MTSFDQPTAAYGSVFVYLGVLAMLFLFLRHTLWCGFWDHTESWGLKCRFFGKKRKKGREREREREKKKMKRRASKITRRDSLSCALNSANPHPPSGCRLHLSGQKLTEMIRSAQHMKHGNHPIFRRIFCPDSHRHLQTYVAFVLLEAPKAPENSRRSKVGPEVGFGGSLKVGRK